MDPARLSILTMDPATNCAITIRCRRRAKRIVFLLEFHFPLPLKVRRNQHHFLIHVIQEILVGHVGRVLRVLSQVVCAQSWSLAAYDIRSYLAANSNA